MNWFRSHISKSLLWLAVAFIPLPQPVAAEGCCCPEGTDPVSYRATDAQIVSSVSAHTSCCRSTLHAGTCCCSDRLASGSSRSHDCPCRCDGHSDPVAFEASFIGPTLGSHWIARDSVTPLSAATIDADMVTSQDFASPTSASGLARCVQLCRFTL